MIWTLIWLVTALIWLVTAWCVHVRNKSFLHRTHIWQIIIDVLQANVVRCFKGQIAKCVEAISLIRILTQLHEILRLTSVQFVCSAPIPRWFQRFLLQYRSTFHFETDSFWNFLPFSDRRQWCAIGVLLLIMVIVIILFFFLWVCDLGSWLCGLESEVHWASGCKSYSERLHKMWHLFFPTRMKPWIFRGGQAGLGYLFAPNISPHRNGGLHCLGLSFLSVFVKEKIQWWDD